MRTGIVLMLVATCNLAGCALHRANQTTASQTAPNNVRILPNTAVVTCHRNGTRCEPVRTTSQNTLSGSVDAFGNVHIDDPAGLPPR